MAKRCWSAMPFFAHSHFRKRLKAKEPVRILASSVWVVGQHDPQIRQSISKLNHGRLLILSRNTEPPPTGRPFRHLGQSAVFLATDQRESIAKLFDKLTSRPMRSRMSRSNPQH